ncbi:unnamed protein product [Cochlearia groenlandica]
MNGEGKAAGASGYIASWIVKLLLLRGYTVKATVRDPKDQKKTEHLLALDGAEERLRLFKANLIEENCFHHAIDGCDDVIHTASPVILTIVCNPQAELIEPAVKGTINVLRTCTRVSSVKRVIVTSSMATLQFSKSPLGPNDFVDEDTFSDPSFCEENKLWYVLSKTLAEDGEWRFAKANKTDMVVEKVKCLGIEFTPTETSLRDTVLSLKEKCLV